MHNQAAPARNRASPAPQNASRGGSDKVAVITAKADRALGKPQPDAALLLHAASKGAIVDDLAVHRLNAACPLESLAPHQHTAARSGRRRIAAPVDPGKR